MLSPEVSIFPLLLAFFPLCSRCQCITNFDVIAFYTHISDCNAKCKAARIRPTIPWESHDSQELMKFEFHHISSICFAQGIPFKHCWCETGRSCSQRQHLPLSAGEPEMKSQESREKRRQMINLLLNCKILPFFFFFFPSWLALGYQSCLEVITALTSRCVWDCLLSSAPRSCITEHWLRWQVTGLGKGCMQNNAAVHRAERDREAGRIKQLLELLEGRV